LFQSFFPRPVSYFVSALIWVLFCGAVWFGFMKDWKPAIDFFGNFVSTTPDVDGRKPFLTADKLYIYVFLISAGVLFGVFWTFASDHKWRRWSVWGSVVILLSTYFNVQIDVFINKWYGEFYDMLQATLDGKKATTTGVYYSYIFEVASILVVSISLTVVLIYFTQHYIFRWRTAMNDYYVEHWPKLRSVEGASQRVQDDTMRFARQLENLGVNFVKSIMTLIAFLPILWTLSAQIKSLPIVGSVDGGLVFVSLISATLGTIMLALIGIKLPGLEFRNQRVEAAYRKELVYGEDHEHRADPLTLNELFISLRKNYFRLYFNYLYFNVAKWAYLQGAAFIPYLAMGPIVVARGITMGIFQQVLNAFGNVDDSLRFFASSWDDIIELQSIYKRLRAFEAAIDEQPFGSIELAYIESGDLNA
jgi:peptide/bleomycin uptake transporter